MYSEQFMRLWAKYKSARQIHEATKDLLETYWKERCEAERHLVEAMMDAGANDPVAIDGKKLYLTADRECSVNKDNIEQVEEWLNSQRGGAEPFMRTAVDPWAVKRLVREELKDGVDPESYPEFLKVAIRPRLNVKGWIGSEDNGEES